MNHVQRLNRIALMTAILFAARSGYAAGQTTKGKPQPKSPIQLAEERANALCDAAVARQKSFLQDAGTKTRFKEMAEALIDVEEKLAQGKDLYDSYDRSNARMRTLFRQHIFDAATLRPAFEAEFLNLQQKLIEDTIRLCKAANVSEKELTKRLEVYEIRKDAWQDPYGSSVIAAAVSISKEDWFREAALFVGSGVAANIIRDGAAESGLWNHEENSFGDILGQFILQSAIDIAVTEMTDPAGEVADSLKAEYDRASATLVSSLEITCRSLIGHHVTLRHQLLGLPVKGVR